MEATSTFIMFFTLETDGFYGKESLSGRLKMHHFDDDFRFNLDFPDEVFSIGRILRSMAGYKLGNEFAFL